MTTEPPVAEVEPPLLSVENLSVTFQTDKESIHATSGLDFEIERGETVGVVGESGSGKSVTARALMGLLESTGELGAESSIKFRDESTIDRLVDDYPNAVRRGDGSSEDETFVIDRDDGDRYVDLAKAPEPAVNQIRGSGIAMVFQDPLTSLNPVYTVGNQIKEALRIHREIRGQEATEVAIELLEDVGIPDPARRMREYPHQFSGGMRQRAIIAMTLACDPELLICDEPTTALDVTIQAQILELLQELQAERDLAILFITHDMGVIAEVADRVSVMYAGEIVEKAPVGPLFESPAHPYTRGLMSSIPSRNLDSDRLETLEGEVPTPHEPPHDCRFAPRCPEAFDACHETHPNAIPIEGNADHTASCLLYPEDIPTEKAVARHTRPEERDQTETGDDTT
jgi:peptide/nickel transport system ATP-binding protein